MKRDRSGSPRMRVWLPIVAFGAALLLLGVARIAPEPVPDQPIDFSHLKHAGDLEMACTYCHTYAGRSSAAGLPTVKRCMGCHDLVAYDAEEVQKLAGYLERDEPIAWQKVFYLPDHTKFFHDRHVKKGVECSTCHGAVETTERFTQVRDFKMGWCIDCHVERQASVDCLACHY